jgi:GH15 family glucan-1,4-alpha-glucosidase
MSSLPIGEYAVVSDCRSAALVSRTGSVDWLCFPRFDGSSIFCRLLDSRGGHWLLRPTAPARVNRRYLEETMVLETTFLTSEGQVVLTDVMPVGPYERGHQLGTASPGALLRLLSCINGEAEVELEYCPRPGYGLIEPLFERFPDGLLTRGAADVLVLSSPWPLEIYGATVRARFRMQKGQRLGFALGRQSVLEDRYEPWSQEAIAEGIDDTVESWRTWSALHQHYEGPWCDLVRHSGRVLQALTFQPTGAIVAAATTSLPETVGGSRNWDYRYTWVRDASLTLEALWIAACPHEAHQFFDWMAAAAAARIRATGLQIMFGVCGEHDLGERELGHLRGWRGSRPVRVGNAAWSQRQLDVYGELLSAARRLRDQLGGVDETTRRFLIEVAETAAASWRQPDQGIWEVRGEARHFLYSKLMCWVAMDSAIDLARQLGAADRVPGWRRTREEIREAIMRRGWSERAQAFTQAFESDHLDASALMMPLVGFLPASHPRIRSTIEAIDGQLTDERGMVYRYRSEDGLEGKEGTFLICTFWLVQALAMAGELDRARAKFEATIAYANDVGLLAEEADPATGELLGNFPQAFSHIGLINAVWAMSRAEEERTILSRVIRAIKRFARR